MLFPTVQSIHHKPPCRVSWVLLLTTLILFVAGGCQYLDKSVLNEQDVLQILYEDLAARVEERYPLQKRPLESVLLSLAFSSASYAGLRKVRDEAGDLDTLLELSRLNKVKLTYKRNETEMAAGGLGKLANYSGQGWWQVSVGSYGQWRINETSREVVADDEKARAIVRKLTPKFQDAQLAEVQLILEYQQMTEESVGGLFQAITVGIEAAALEGDGPISDTAKELEEWSEYVGSLKWDLQQLQAPPRAIRFSSLLYQGLVLAERGLGTLSSLFLDASKGDFSDRFGLVRISKEEFGKRARERYRDGIASLDQATSKLSEAQAELSTLYDYAESQTKAIDRKTDLTVDVAQLNRLVQEHDVAFGEVREYIQGLWKLRAWDMTWTQRKEGRISAGGLRQLGFDDLVKRAESAELLPFVQQALQYERGELRRMLGIVQQHQKRLTRLTPSQPSILTGFHESAESALSIEEQVLTSLLVFYDNDQFVRKGRETRLNPVGETRREVRGDVINTSRTGGGYREVVSSQDFIDILVDAPDKLREALVLWEAAKIRLELTTGPQ